MKSVLLLGQSNMAGRGFLSEVAPIRNERILMLRNGRWQMMDEPINPDRSVAGVGPAASFADLWTLDHPGETIGLIPCAEGGSALEEWGPQGRLFRHAIALTRLALEDSELLAILWHQGESDAIGGRHRDYRTGLERIENALRAELDAPETPFIVGGLGDYLGRTGFGLAAAEHAEITAELRRYAAEREFVHFVTAEGLSANPDGIHIDAPSQRRFGVRYYEALRTGGDVLAPIDEDAALARCAAREVTPAERSYEAMEAFARGRSTFEEFLEALPR